MAVKYACDRCGFKTEESGVVKRYSLALTPDKDGGVVPGTAASADSTDAARARTIDLCDKCVDRAWRVIAEQLFRGEK